MSGITVEVRARAVIEGTVECGGSIPPYEGSYEIEPSESQQVFATRNRVMKEDVTLKGIAYQEVTNTSGGQTVTIGGR